MSLYVCEASKNDEIKIIKSRFFKNKIKLIVKPGSGSKCELVSDAAYVGEDKYYFPFFQHLIFRKSSKKELAEESPLYFSSLSPKENEIEIIKDLIEKKKNDEKIQYDLYKKNLEKDLSSFIDSLSREIENQIRFLKNESIIKDVFNENIKTLIDAYKDIIKIKIENDNTLKSDDSAILYDFYVNMIEGLTDTRD